MIKVRLFCAAGFSTGMLVNNIKAAAEKRDITLDIEACAQNAIEKESDGIDVALLGPQVSYTLAKSKAVCEAKGVKIDVIPMADYGMLDGDKVLDLVLKLVAS